MRIIYIRSPDGRPDPQRHATPRSSRRYDNPQPREPNVARVLSRVSGRAVFLAATIAVHVWRCRNLIE
jgi:hypothetical protein